MRQLSGQLLTTVRRWLEVRKIKLDWMPDHTVARTKKTTRFGASVYISIIKTASKEKAESEPFPGNLTTDLATRTRQTPSCRSMYDAGILSMSIMVRVRSTTFISFTSARSAGSYELGDHGTKSSWCLCRRSRT